MRPSFFLHCLLLLKLVSRAFAYQGQPIFHPLFRPSAGISRYYETLLTLAWYVGGAYLELRTGRQVFLFTLHE
jgi:hypothetical protein